MRTWLFYEGRILKTPVIDPANERMLRLAAQDWTKGKPGRRVEVHNGRGKEVIRNGK